MRLRRRFGSSPHWLVYRSQEARHRARSVARGVVELVAMIRREAGRLTPDQERQLAELGRDWTRSAYQHGRGSVLLAEHLGPGWHYDARRCDCGGSGWRPGVSESSECCPYHGEPGAEELES